MMMRIVTTLIFLFFSLHSAAQKKPNIVLIMVDDASWEAFESYGSAEYKTPNLVKLANQGVQFQHTYATPICTTSRVMIMTGQQNFRNYTHFGYLNPTSKTFGHLLQKAGYKTAIAGKWQLNGLYNPEAFDNETDNKRPFHAGFDEYALWQLTLGKNRPKNSDIGGERFWSPTLEKNGKVYSSKDNANLYGPDLMSGFLLDFIDRHQKEPFFIYYPTTLVHAPFVPTPDTIGDNDRSQDANKQPTAPEARKANFQAMILYTDKIVGRFISKLEKLNLLEDTLILFTADNGTDKRITSNWQGQKIIGGKRSLTDMGTHVPLIAYWKGKTSTGVKNYDLIDFTDFYPTLADVAGITLTNEDPKDGRSFLPQLLGKKGKPRDVLYTHYQAYWGGKGGIFARTQDYKLYPNGRFINVPNDLKETNNLHQINDKKIQHTKKKLLNVIKQLPVLPKGGKSPKFRPIHPDWSIISVDDTKK